MSGITEPPRCRTMAEVRAGVDALDEVAHAQEVRLTGGGGATAYVYGGDGRVRAENYGATGGGVVIGPVTGGNARDRRNCCILFRHRQFLFARPMR